MSYTQRTADWVIGKAYQVAKAKGAPTTGNKYTTLLTIVDNEQKDWASEPSVQWSSLYSMVTLPVTVSATDTFLLDTSIQYISKRYGDTIQLSNGTATKSVKLVAPDQLWNYRNEIACARIGRNLKFSKAFASDSQYLGFSIKVPSITFPPDVATGTDPIVCDDPMYLVYMVAAEFARNDLIKTSQYDNILAKAEERMNRMKQDNGGHFDTLPTPAFAMGQDW